MPQQFRRISYHRRQRTLLLEQRDNTVSAANNTTHWSPGTQYLTPKEAEIERTISVVKLSIRLADKFRTKCFYCCADEDN